MQQRTRPAPVDSTFMHMFNDAFIFIQSSTLEAEIRLFESAIQLGDISPIQSDDQTVFESLAEQLQQLLAGCVLQPGVDELRNVLSSLSEKDRGYLLYRLQQIAAAVQLKHAFHPGDTFVVSSVFHHRWFELVAGRVLHADVICLDADEF